MFPRYIVRKSSELRTGDIILNAGMKVLLDGAIQSRPYTTEDQRAAHGGTDAVYWQRGLVVNLDEIEDPWLVSVTREYQEWPNRHIPTGEHRWTIQGNDLATWAVALHGPDTAEDAGYNAGYNA